ncbi:MAG: hypothetical protein V4584_08720 [Verrucomicrobiota bacterium]
MLNPISTCKTPLSSRVAMPLGLLLAGIFGLGISMIQPTPVEEVADSTGSGTPASAAPSLPQEMAQIPEDKTPPVTAENLVSFCSKHVTAKRSFVVFKRGTCVIVTEPCEDPKAEAKKILAQCNESDARFVAEPTTEGDVIVAFKDPVFHRFSKGELQKLKPWLSQSATALLTPEESMSAGDGWIPPSGAQVGLLARRRLLEDAANAVPVKIIRAKERAIASR